MSSRNNGMIEVFDAEGSRALVANTPARLEDMAANGFYPQGQRPEPEPASDLEPDPEPEAKPKRRRGRVAPTETSDGA